MCPPPSNFLAISLTGTPRDLNSVLIPHGYSIKNIQILTPSILPIIFTLAQSSGVKSRASWSFLSIFKNATSSSTLKLLSTHPSNLSAFKDLLFILVYNLFKASSEIFSNSSAVIFNGRGFANE